MKDRSGAQREAKSPAPTGRTGRMEAIQAALSELSGIVGGIVATAEEKSSERCPYMDTRRECTAAFFCANQVRPPGRARPLCSGQHKVNFSIETNGCPSGQRKPNDG